MKNLMVLVLALGITGTASAESLPESLLSCDSNFFSKIYSQKATFKNVVPLNIDKAGHAWFAPKEGSEIVWFAHSIPAGQLTLSGYWQQNSDLDEMGKYYFWGLIIDESPEAVMAALSDANWKKSAGGFFANPMIKPSGSQEWLSNSGVASGIAPAKGSVEKLAILDVYNGKSRLLCSIQGSVTGADLLSLRPDLAEENQ